MRARQVSEQLSQQRGRSPTYVELAHELGVPEEDVIEAIEVGRQYELLSIDALGGERAGEESQSEAERQGDLDPDLEDIGARDEIQQALRQLADRERVIVVLRYFREMSQQEVGDRLGISQMHVSRLQHRALERLRHILGRQR